MSYRLLMGLSCAALAACSGGPSEGDSPRTEDAFSSEQATLLQFAFDGELVTDSSFGARGAIDDQMLYTIGHLNGSRSVGRLDNLTVSNVRTTPTPDGKTRVTYHATLPVAWGSKQGLPSTYSFTLPRRVSWSGLEDFTTKYKASCVDWAAHDVDSGSMWYYFRPRASGCQLDPNDVVNVSVAVTRAPENTTGKYPEYHKVWEDNALRAVAIFGKNKDGETSGDAGIQAFNAFVASMRRVLTPYGLTTVPATVPTDPGVQVPDVTLSGALPDGKTISVTALLVDNVRTAGAAFDRRYETLSADADVIMYNGHAGLGQNVRALARKGRFLPGRYLLLFMNGCDTFAYVDGSLAETRAALNPDDTEGTKYMDIVTNAMPSYFSSNAPNSTTLIETLMRFDRPKTFDQMFASIDRAQVVVVTGEEDNAFQPGMPIGTTTPPPVPGTWSGLDESGSVARREEKRFTTPEIDAGTYVFELSGTGDADLYVKKGSSPSVSAYDCRPYKSGSAEVCKVTLTERGIIHTMVRGYAATSTFRLVGKPSP